MSTVQEFAHEWVPLPGHNRGQPIGCFPQYTQHDREVTVKLREKIASLTGNDYDITTPDGYLIFKIKGKVMSLHAKKTMFDKDGAPILSVSDKIMTVLRQFDIHAGESIKSDPVAHVEGHFSLTKNKLTATFNNYYDGTPTKLEIVGSLLDRKCEITCDGQSVARVHRKWLNMGELLFDMSTYYLTVAPGADLALLSAIVVCLNEKTDGKS